VTRIIAGEFGGRRLAAPSGRQVRPTADRVREAWMSILAPQLPGANVVDLCAGTGALGLETLSRGAARADFVEQAPAALDLLRRNIEGLGVGDRARVVRSEAVRFVTGLSAGVYDVALADPPYADETAARIAAAWRACPFAGVLAIEHAAKQDLGGDDTRRYGDTALTFWYAP
jgi:16S rRNA (guanine966-N2)-methyltransferase